MYYKYEYIVGNPSQDDFVYQALALYFLIFIPVFVLGLRFVSTYSSEYTRRNNPYLSYMKNYSNNYIVTNFHALLLISTYTIAS